MARSIRLLHMLLGIVAKHEKRDKFQVTLTSAPYLAALVSVSEEVRCRCHLKYHNENNYNNTNNQNTNIKPNNAPSVNSTKSLIETSNIQASAGTCGSTNLNSPVPKAAGTVYLMTQSPSNNSLADDLASSNASSIIKNNTSTITDQVSGQNNSISSSKAIPDNNGDCKNSSETTNSNLANLSSFPASSTPNSGTSLLQSQQPKRQRSCDIIDSKTIITAKSNKQTCSSSNNNNNNNTNVNNNNGSNTSALNSAGNNSGSNTGSLLQLAPLASPSSNFLNPAFLTNNQNKGQMRKSLTVQNQQTLTNLQKNYLPINQANQKNSFLSPNPKNIQNKDLTNSDSARNNVGELNVLLDPLIINDYPTQALLLTVLATLVRKSTDENEIRILYQYIAEASIVFPKVFPVIHNLLDSKINHILQLSLDESILDSVQSIIQNMIFSCETTDSNQQQLSYLQSCGFGGLWRFAQPFAAGREKPENVELFIDCLEAMVETCLPQDSENFSCESTTTLVSANNANITSNNQSQSTSIINQTSTANLNQSVNNFFHLSSTSNLITGSMSSISMGSIHDRDLYELNELNRLRNNSIRRNSSPKNMF